jgi:hypothetical protein
MAPERASMPGSTGGTGEEPKPAVDGARDVIDRSIGMYLLRRVASRRPIKPTTDDAELASAVLTADEVAYRIGAAGADHPARRDVTAPPARVGAAAVADEAAPAGAARLTPGPTYRTSSGGPPAPRERLVRDSGIALLALAGVGLAAFAFWPHPPAGEPESSFFVVNRAVVTPEPTGEVDAATSEPSVDVSIDPATPAVSAQPTTPTRPDPTTAGSAAPRARPTARLTPRPATTTAPTATRTPTPPPGPTVKPTAKPTPTPAPTGTPPPTPEPTEPPTPEPTAPPTPDPTPEESPSP